MDAVDDCSAQQTRKSGGVEQLLQAFVTTGVQLSIQLMEKQVDIFHQTHDVLAFQVVWKRHR